jgi:hypothetical protein
MCPKNRLKQAAEKSPEGSIEVGPLHVSDFLLLLPPPLLKSLWWIFKFFFEKHNTNTDTHTRMSTHPYEHTHYLYEHIRKTEPV